MLRILFVCHGNICRSPMAEYVMKDLVSAAGLEDLFYIDSAATSSEEIGNSVYPPAQRKLREVGIRNINHRARRMERYDYQRFDYLIGMEQYNIRNMLRILGSDPEGKVARLLDFSNRPRDISDPWYTDDFDTAYDDILEGCTALLRHIRKENGI